MRITDSRATTTRPLTFLVLTAGAWLLVGWSILGYEDATRAVFVDVLAGLALLTLATVQLLYGPTHRLSVLMVWTGLAVALAPHVLQYGYVEPVVPAFVNDMIVGVVVMGAGALLSRRAAPMP